MKNSALKSDAAVVGNKVFCLLWVMKNGLIITRRWLIMPKRGENVRKRKDVRWEGRYSVKDIYYGTTQVRSVYAKTYAEVRRK